MVKKRLISFGDSWAQGSELLPKEKTFGELLSEQLGCIEFSNYAVPASSINHLIIQLKSHLHRLLAMGLDPSDWMAIFFLTDHNRGATAHNGQWIFQNAAGGFGELAVDRQLVDQVNTAYWKYIHSPELSTLTANSTILALQRICQTHGIDDYYVAGWQTLDLWPEVDVDKFYQGGKVSCGRLIGMQSDIPSSYVNRQNLNQSPGGHPNQLGHQIIADSLYKWITDCAR